MTEAGRAKLGRPTADTPEVREEICLRRIRGEKLIDICRDDHLPAYETVIRWWIGEPGDGHDLFRQAYARAMMAWAQGVVDEIVEIADDADDDWRWDERKGRHVPNNDAPSRAKVRIDARKWIAGKVLPKLYGDRAVVDHTSSDGSLTGARTLTDASLRKLSTSALREVLSVLSAGDAEPGADALPAPERREDGREPDESGA